jgi:trimethylamine--corrinoid protein Co-methyltransferase
MRAQVEWLSTAEKDLIYEEALGLLGRMGMKFGACKAIDTLAGAGATVDRETGVVTFPRALVERALKTCKRDIVLGGATPADDCVMDGEVHFTPSGTPNHTLDFETGDYRPSTHEDLRQATIVADAQPAVDIMWPLVTGVDCPEEQQLFLDYSTVLKVSPLHIQHEIHADWQIEPLMRMMEVVCGSREEFRRRPRISFTMCTASPLSVNGPVLDTNITMAGYGTPILVYPMPIAGATAPITVAGTVTMDVAEWLGVMTAIKLSDPNAPVLMGAGTSVLDMRATTFSFGALEAGLMCAAVAEVGHHLGVPVLCRGLATDAKYGGIQAGFEKALKGLVCASAGADLITGGIGLLNGANVMSLPQIVIDGEIAAMIKRIVAEREVSHETVMAEMIERIGWAGNYLKEKDTRTRVRAGETFFPTVATRLSFEMWKQSGTDEFKTASAEVRTILRAADERGPIMSAADIKAIDEIADRGAAEAVAKGLI